MAGKNIEDDGLIGAERTVAALVRIATLQAAGDDGVGGATLSGMEHGGVHLGAKALGSQRNAGPFQETALVGFAGLEDVDAAAEAGLGDAERSGECLHFILSFARALRKKGLLGDDDLESAAAEVFQEVRRGIARGRGRI